MDNTAADDIEPGEPDLSALRAFMSRHGVRKLDLTLELIDDDGKEWRAEARAANFRWLSEYIKPSDLGGDGAFILVSER